LSTDVSEVRTASVIRDKLTEIGNTHRQVDLIEINTDRKYHTRHGLHFNKLGKSWFSKKITQMIYSIVRNKQKNNIMSESSGIEIGNK
jgi:hypothetical protein